MSFTKRELLTFLEKQVESEKEIVSSVSKALKTIRNPVIEAIFKGLSYDSSKHAEIYKSATRIVTVAPALTEEEFGNLKELVKWHIEKEEKLIESLEKAIALLDNVRIKFLFESILTDEKRHHDLLNMIMKIIVEGETITDKEWWEIMWRNVPSHGSPGG